MPVTLTPRQRSQLKARAHALEPAVYVGKAGVQEAIVREIDRALTAHELIKVRIDADREERESMAAILADRTDSAVVQRVGKIVVVWRPRVSENS